jgi:hypothetical protein
MEGGGKLTIMALTDIRGFNPWFNGRGGKSELSLWLRQYRGSILGLMEGGGKLVWVSILPIFNDGMGWGVNPLVLYGGGGVIV